MGVGVPICPLCPGAGEHINSAVSSQTRAPRARPCRSESPPPPGGAGVVRRGLAASHSQIHSQGDRSAPESP